MQEISQIRANLEKAKSLLQELNSVTLAYGKANTDERALLNKTVKALIDQLSILYEPLPSIAQSIRFDEQTRKAVYEKSVETIEQGIEKKRKVERIATATGPVYISAGHKKKFLEELNLSEQELKAVKSKIMKKKISEAEELVSIIKPSSLAVLSSKMFGSMASSMTKAALFKSVERDLRKASMPYMLSSYISIIFFVTFVSFFITLAVALAVSLAMQATFLEAIRNVAIAIVFTILIFFIALTYPANIARSNKKKLETELPFATAHMAAIASSKVEPSKIFAIMATTKEYKIFSLEIRKVINQINVYGYDLSTALRNAAKTSPSKKYADLLNGMITTITTGGSLITYLQEKSKSLLIDYRLSHERYTNVIGMYSDIYTALLIAAPLMFMLLLAIISIMGTSFLAMDVSVLANIGIMIIAVLNILFIVFLQLTQPEI